MRKKKFVLLFGLGIIGSYSLIAYAHTVPGWDEPYDIDLYYSLTEISWADSPSPYALKDLASNGGNVFDYTRSIKSILFADKLISIV